MDAGADSGDAPNDVSEANIDVSIEELDAASEVDANGVVADASTTAVFVSVNGSDLNDGTRSHPFSTIAAGVVAAKSKGLPLWVCAGTYAAPVQIGPALDGIAIRGGFDCLDWSPDPGKTSRVRPTDATRPALEVSGVKQGVTISDMVFEEPDAAIGGSSTAVIVRASVGVVMRNVTITAGQGGGGADGEQGRTGAPGTLEASDRDAGSRDGGTSEINGRPAECAGLFGPGVLAGGTWGGQRSACGSQGGNGGSANRGLPGSAGTPGIPLGSDNGGPVGADGQRGVDGAPGSAGDPNSARGRFNEVGYSPAAPGGTGAPGAPGQGGGGGGATSTAIPECIGASGGAGGMGGCGGAGGVGGRGGGASIAMLAWDSSVTLESCVLTSSAGGPGGRGGNGGAGGDGGEGAVGGASSSGYAGRGGLGGNGGSGGAGAGGNGGPSYALAWRGIRPAMTLVTTYSGNPGARGLGGSLPSTGPSGIDGDAAGEYQVP